jgi:hypothetical protein
VACVWHGRRRSISVPTAGATTPRGSLTHGAPTRHGTLAYDTPKPSGGVEAELTDGVQGGVATAADDKGWEWIPEFLHDLRSVREAPLHQKWREEPWHNGSPEGGDWRRHDHGAAVLRPTRCGAGGSASCTEGRGCS